MPDYTRWLNASTSSRDEELFAGLYVELHRIALGRIAAERPGQTLDAGSLVHEAWLRLQRSVPEQWRDRKQFYAAAAEAMPRIIREVEQPKPSSRLSTVAGEERTTLAKAHRIDESKLNRLVEPDLDWIGAISAWLKKLISG